jgi:heptosyltransferase-1
LRVLVVKTSSLGDVIHTLPALTDAAAARPGIRFDWAVEEAFAEIPAWHPAVERVIPVAIRRWRRSFWRGATRREWRDCGETLGAVDYDAVIDAQGLIKSALLARRVRAPRYGYDRDSAREPLAALGYQHAIAVPVEMHAVERIRHLFAAALGYERPAGGGDYGVRRQLLADGGGGSTDAELLFFHGTARDEKLWPEPRWIELADLAGRAGYAVRLPWGNDAERERAERIAGAAPCAGVLPRLSLGELAARLLRVRGAVAVDTGLGHLAAALDVPAVSLYGPTRVELIGAYGANQAHIRSPLADADPSAMMAAIEAPAVWSALQGLLSPGSAGAGAP